MSNALASIVPIITALENTKVNHEVLNPGSVRSMQIRFATPLDLMTFTREWIRNGALCKDTKREDLLLEIFIAN